MGPTLSYTGRTRGQLVRTVRTVPCRCVLILYCLMRSNTTMFTQEEAAQLTSFVESVTRKNRHLVQELAESQRSSEDLFAANVRLQVGSGTVTIAGKDTGNRQPARLGSGSPQPPAHGTHGHTGALTALPPPSTTLPMWLGNRLL